MHKEIEVFGWQDNTPAISYLMNPILSTSVVLQTSGMDFVPLLDLDLTPRVGIIFNGVQTAKYARNFTCEKALNAFLYLPSG